MPRAHPSPSHDGAPGLPQPLPAVRPGAPPAPLTRGVLGRASGDPGARGSLTSSEPHTGTRRLLPADPSVADVGPGVRVRGCGWAGNFARTGSESADSPDAARPVPGDRCPCAAALPSTEEGARSSRGRQPGAPEPAQPSSPQLRGLGLGCRLPRGFRARFSAPASTPPP